MDIALVANAASGSGTDVGSVERTLSRHGARVRTLLPPELDAWLERGGDARELLGDAERVAVAGGDGTVGVAAALAAAAGVPLAVLPAGTANDFARHLDVPLDLAGATALAADPQAATRAIDLAWIGSIPFVNAAHAGLSVSAARAAAPLKRFAGPLAYPAGALAAAIRDRPVRCRITCDGEPAYEGDAWQVTVAGTGAFGAGSELDAADPRDGMLDVAVLTAGPRARLARHAVGMRNGRLTDQPGVRHVRGCEIAVDGPDCWNVDGERRHVVAARFRVQTRALDAVVPR